MALKPIISLLVLLAGLLAAGPAHALTFNVTTDVDVADATPGDDFCETATGNGVCTLRAAVEEANAGASDPDTINVPAGTYQLTAAAGGALFIANGSEYFIDGAGARSTIIQQETSAGDGVDRVFDILAGSGFLETVVSISDVTLADGRALAAGGEWGGVLRNTAADVTLTRTTITGGRAASGGGVANIGPGVLNIVDSTIVDNDGDDDAGGIANIESIANDGFFPDLNVTNTTISGNSAPNAGGIHSWSENSSATSAVDIINTTITANTAGFNGGGMIMAHGATATVANSIVAGNSAQEFFDCDTNGGSYFSEGFNITGCGFANTGDQDTDPLLSELANNGGPTDTHAIAADSPARDNASDAFCPAADQRGVTRPVGFCDIGAFEFQEPVPPGDPPPVAATTAAALVEFDSAQLNGTVETNGLATDWFFEYGPTTAYGSQTPVTGLAGALLPQAVIATVSGLESNTTYHYRVRASNSGGESTGANMTFTTAKKTLADLPPPVLGRTTNVEPVAGRVRVALPAGAAAARRGRAAQKGLTFVPLEEARQIPMGSFLDTKRGTVRLQTARRTGSRIQAGNFSKGLFQVLQARSGRQRGLTDLRLKGASFSRCGSAGRRGKRAGFARKRLSGRTVRRLRGNARGSFRTRGRHSAATVRGTAWVTADRCDGTLTTVKRGKVAVRDFRRKRTVIVRAGKNYLAQR